MSIEILTQFRARPGHSGELLSLVLHLLPNEQRPEGCLDVHVRQNQDDENDIVAEQRWQSRQQAERWRANPHTLTAIRALLAEPMSARYFDTITRHADTDLSLDVLEADVQARALPTEIPKVSTPDALGG